MKKILKKAVDLLPAPIADRIHAVKHRNYWLGKGSKSHETYFDKYRTRSQIVETLRDWLNASPRPSLRILELGCSGGNNLQLLRESFAIPIRYVGLDIQPDAIAFARARFPDDVFMVGDDQKLLELAPDWGRFDVFLVSAVLSYIPQKQSQAVLSMVAKVADCVLICDDLSQFASPDGANDGIFLHPYARMCQRANLEIVRQPSPPRSGDRYSIFMARSLMR